jgi:hypothetical protein
LQFFNCYEFMSGCTAAQRASISIITANASKEIRLSVVS